MHLPKVLTTGLVALTLVALPVSVRGDSGSAIVGGLALGLIAGAVCGSLYAPETENDADEDAFARRGWLVGVKGAYAIQDFESKAQSDLNKKQAQEGEGPSSLSFDDSFGISGYAGYRCHPRVSSQVQVEWVEFDGDIRDPGIGKVATIDTEAVTVTANVKGYLLTGRFQPYLLVGGGGMTVKSTARDTVGLGFSESKRGASFAMRFGGGIELYATRHLVVSVEADYLLPIGDLDLPPLRSLDSYEYLSIGGGLQYRF